LIINKNIPLWRHHWERLNTSLERLQLDPLNENDVYKNIHSLVSDNKNYVVKLVVFRDGNKRGYGSQEQNTQYYLTVTPFVKIFVDKALTLSSITLANQKCLAGIKHLNRLEQVMAANELNGSQFSDTIMCNTDGLVIETISKNIVLIKGQQLYTPKLDDSGVYGVALRWLESQGFKLKWKKIELSTLAEYHGMMICNSIQGFTIINNIEELTQFKYTPAIANEIIERWDSTVAQ
jgi:4-amino-4-deoxychorismate lyase